MKTWLSKSSWAMITIYFLLIVIFGRPLFNKWGFLHLHWLLGFSIIVLKYIDDWRATKIRLASVSNSHLKLTMKMIALLPPIIPAFFSLNKSIIVGFFDFLLTRPPHSESIEGTRFTYLLNGQYSSFVIIIFIGLIVEVPFSILLINIVEKNPDMRMQIHAILIALTLYTFIAVLSDRWQLQSSQHVVGNQYLHLRLGFRFSSNIAYEHIDKICLINDTKRIWCAKNKVSFLDEFTVSPIDQPQILIEFKDDSQPQMESLRLSQNLPKYLFVFVDNPRAFINAIEDKLVTLSLPRQNGSHSEGS